VKTFGHFGHLKREMCLYLAMYLLKPEIWTHVFPCASDQSDPID